jgi:pyruvate/2-oxoglutarate dehydrogenase complex dihydrolipoamide dehydrogenase (E3) component
VDTDLVVIGGGAAGLSAARAGRRRGATVTLVSDSPLGGDCTFTGCVPSKTLINAARRGDSFDEAMAEVRRTVESIAADESFDVVRGEGIGALNERAMFVDRNSIEVGGRSIRTRRFVVATGAKPSIPPIPGLDASRVLTSERLFTMSALPRRLAILGGGPIGVEMAEAFARLGSRVTVIEAMDRILPREEPESSAVIAEFLEQLGVTVRTKTSCTAVEHCVDHTTLALDVGTVGRTPSSVGFGLETIGVRMSTRGFIEVDDRLRTSVRTIFAAGDVAQTLQFTHVADENGRMAAANALSRVPVRRFHPEWIPAVTFTSLEVARVGVLESEVGHDRARVAYLPMTEFDRARISGDTRGFVKIITEPRRLSGHQLGGTIVGATIVAPRAGEMLAEIVLAMRTGMWPARLAMTTHAYPTWGLAVQQTVAQLFGEFGGRTARKAIRVE